MTTPTLEIIPSQPYRNDDTHNTFLSFKDLPPDTREVQQGNNQQPKKRSYTKVAEQLVIISSPQQDNIPYQATINDLGRICLLWEKQYRHPMLLLANEESSMVVASSVKKGDDTPPPPPPTVVNSSTDKEVGGSSTKQLLNGKTFDYKSAVRIIPEDTGFIRYDNERRELTITNAVTRMTLVLTAAPFLLNPKSSWSWQRLARRIVLDFIPCLGTKCISNGNSQNRNGSHPDDDRDVDIPFIIMAGRQNESLIVEKILPSPSGTSITNDIRLYNADTNISPLFMVNSTGIDTLMKETMLDSINTSENNTSQQKSSAATVTTMDAVVQTKNTKEETSVITTTVTGGKETSFILMRKSRDDYTDHTENNELDDKHINVNYSTVTHMESTPDKKYNLNSNKHRGKYGGSTNNRGRSSSRQYYNSSSHHHHHHHRNNSNDNDNTSFNPPSMYKNSNQSVVGSMGTTMNDHRGYPVLSPGQQSYEEYIQHNEEDTRRQKFSEPSNTIPEYGSLVANTSFRYPPTGSNLSTVSENHPLFQSSVCNTTESVNNSPPPYIPLQYMMTNQPINNPKTVPIIHTSGTKDVLEVSTIPNNLSSSNPSVLPYYVTYLPVSSISYPSSTSIGTGGYSNLSSFSQASLNSLPSPPPTTSVPSPNLSTTTMMVTGTDNQLRYMMIPAMYSSSTSPSYNPPVYYYSNQ